MKMSSNRLSWLAVAVLLTLAIYGYSQRPVKLATPVPEATPVPTPKVQLPCAQKVKVFVLSAAELEDKVKELGAEGYCVGMHSLNVVGDKVILIVNIGDLYDPDAEETED